MTERMRAPLAFAVMAALLVSVGLFQSWSVALAIFNLCLISAVMALGVNIQWGYAGLFNVGIMAFTAIGGVAAVLVSYPPVREAWTAGGAGLMASIGILVIMVGSIALIQRRMPPGWLRRGSTVTVLALGVLLLQRYFGTSTAAIEGIDPAKTGFLGGLGLPILLSWIIGGVMAAGVAWVIGKIALGLRSDYLAIATLGISEIVIAVIKNEDWLVRGVKNVTALPRPVPYEVNLQQTDWFIDLVARFNSSRLEDVVDPAVREALLNTLVVEGSSLFVKLSYSVLFLIVLLIILGLSQRALNSPWGRMMRAIRDNDEAASAMGKDVTWRHLQVFVLGSAVVGIAGAMMTTLDGQFTPGSYQPLRFTFLIWVMVIVGGSGNNLGAVFGGFLIWFIWIEAEPVSLTLMSALTSGLAEGSAVRDHLIESAPHLRLFVMGLVLLLVMRFSPKGVLPEKVRHT
ncbi:MAG: branched-chain amino acid ABC transporter permease [Hyphomicrobiales bacterium]|nr:branched-chain amino acid ABC transporter permease [Hyphomicrobiales bacterium]